MNSMRSVFTRRALAPAFALVAVLLVASAGCIASSPIEDTGPGRTASSLIEDTGPGWITFHGTSQKDAPYMEISCVVGLSRPTLVIYAGSDRASALDANWRVQIGDWSTESVWETKPYPGYRGGLQRGATRPLEFEIFQHMIESDVDSFTITMAETYTFSLSDDIRAQLEERFPESCYTGWAGGQS